jgi:hypothetical protein
VLVSMSRMMIDAFVTPDSADRIRDGHHEASVRNLAKAIADRADQVDCSEHADTVAHLEELIDEWILAARTNNLAWSPRQGRPIGLLRRPEQERGGGIWPTPQSMREVDPPSPVMLRQVRPTRFGGNNDG